MQKSQPRCPMTVDLRWHARQGGIGRFSAEVIPRLDGDFLGIEGKCLTSSPLDPFYLDWSLRRRGMRGGLFYTPGYNPPATRYCRALLTLHDLMHVTVPEESSRAKRLYYDCFVRPAIRDAGCFLTVSSYSAGLICDWAGLPAEAAVVVGNGVSEVFCETGERAAPGYRYLLFVGNYLAHRNFPYLLKAFAALPRIHEDLRILVLKPLRPAVADLAKELRIDKRIVYYGAADDQALASLYRGASLVAVPSLMEGFGLPVVEAMACGTPVIAGNSSSLPEVAGGAALLVDPLRPEAMTEALSSILDDETLAARLREEGLVNTRRFRWSEVARRVQLTISRLR